MFGQNVLVYASWLCVVGVWFYLTRTRPGLNVRAVGESPAAADAMGINVVSVPLRCTRSSAARSPASAGATFTLAITPQWVSGITGGAGWIAIALVIFAFWRPELCLVGAYFFGALQALAPELQARADPARPDGALDELAAVRDDDRRARARLGERCRRRLGAPAALGAPYVREDAERDGLSSADR